MNLEYLRTFADVVRLGSFSEVAKKQNLTQPGVSFQIQRLERELGVRLLDRTQKGIMPTEAGKRLLRFAEAVEKEQKKLLTDLERLRQEVSGELLLAASTIPGEFLLPAILSEFKARHPAVGIQVAVSDSLTVISQVEKGTYEVGFCGIAPEGRGLEFFRVAGDEIVLAVFPEHPFARRQRVTLPEVIEEPLIFREETSGTQKSLETHLLKYGLNPGQYTPQLIMGTSQAVVSAIEAHAGIAFVSALAVKKSTALGLVKVVPVEEVSLRRDFFCVYRGERIVSRLLEEFIAFVRAGAPVA